MFLNKKSEDNGFKPKTFKPKQNFNAKFFKSLIYTLTFTVLAILFILVLFVILKSLHVFEEQGFWSFITGTNWKPGKDGEGQYGIGLIIIMTIVLLTISMLFAIPLTIFTTLFISEYLSVGMQKKVLTVIKLLASVPSVVFGLFARDQIGALFQLMGAPNNDNLMVASMTMTFMAAPTMISLSYNAVQSVPEGYRLGSLGLGISKEQTTFKIIRKSASAKIISAIILGMARVIGETMAIMMIAGNSTGGFITNSGISGFLFSSIRTLAATIGLEMTENSGSTHQSALYAIGLILFLLVFIINIVILFMSNVDNIKYSRRIKREEKLNSNSSRKIKTPKYVYDKKMLGMMVHNRTENKFFKKTYSAVMLFLMWISTAIIISFTFWILGDVIIKGLMGLSDPIAFIHMDTENRTGGGIFAALFTTILLVVCTLIFAIPFALGAAIYLNEYARQSSVLTKSFRFAINLLASTPSIVFGIFGLSIFIVLLGLPFSILAAGLTMTVVVLPMLISNFEDALQQVPHQYREAGSALGLTKIQTLFKIILPNAMEGIITGIILAMAKIIGESAPIYLTLGTDIQMPTQGFLSQGTTLTTGIYMMVAEGIPGHGQGTIYLMALITIILIIGLNFTSGRLSSLLVQKSKDLKAKSKIKRKEFNVKTKAKIKKMKPSLKFKWMKLQSKFRKGEIKITFFKEMASKNKLWVKRRKEYRKLKKGVIDHE
ncbi:phosphate ABC transporter permease component [Mesoplasma florum L1]|uniref:Phosphate transport system permease protein PstA n=2 Tax=Mesoplasma florum TaxID=2151 RepID=Q6F1N2_MESFL|nr:phosphate ABC transporter permease PstA [Mesoplasma florum]AAT75591.1 phosphate ABC transporter permease component [Mesoplasma florum L1]AGY41307.1 Phosphate transport system permease protein PstAC [Mesoplasma florum W37]ATI73189.1 phosphate ABC transporter, permease protein PstA [Mesoplasma florum]AVN59533.1 phosphate ABC transporter, permease protein PstA [Mesoplasma florum]AVN61591.1 phosphate ABC transporter, permease protein PstA [Mesoplasma florum]